jgi:hypothetical protein
LVQLADFVKAALVEDWQYLKARWMREEKHQEWSRGGLVKAVAQSWQGGILPTTTDRSGCRALHINRGIVFELTDRFLEK